jgi:hypothetical protein
MKDNMHMGHVSFTVLFEMHHGGGLASASGKELQVKGVSPLSPERSLVEFHMMCCGLGAWPKSLGTAGRRGCLCMSLVFASATHFAGHCNVL